MTTHFVSFIQSLVREQPTSPFSVDFYGELPESISTPLIESNPKNSPASVPVMVTMSKTKRIKVAIDNPGYMPRLVDYIEKNLPDIDPAKLLGDDEIQSFTSLTRGWMSSVLLSGRYPFIVPDYPPQMADGEERPNYALEATLVAQEIRKHKTNGSDSGETFQVPVFPENSPFSQNIQLLSWLAVLYGSTTDEEYYKVASVILEPFHYYLDKVEGIVTVSWSSDAEFLKAELNFLRSEKRFSTGYINYRKSLKGAVDESDKMIELEAAKLGVDPVVLKGDEPPPDQDKPGGSGVGGKNDEEKEIPPDGSISGPKVGGDEEKKADAPPGGGLRSGKYDHIFEHLRAKAGGKDKGKAISVDYQPVMPQLPKRKVLEDAMRTVGFTVAKQEHTRILDLEMPGKAHVTAAREIRRDYTFDVTGVRRFLRDNGLAETELIDTVYGIIMVKLISGRAVLINTPGMSTNTLVDDPNSQVTTDKLDMYAPYALRMVDTAMFYACQGARDGALKWYDSYCELCGKFMSEKRFITTCEDIISSGILVSYTAKVTITHIKSLENLFKYRLRRLSAAELIFRAMNMVSSDFVFRLVDSEALLSYLKFHKAGVLGQIAAGPLKGYCRGRIDCLQNYILPPDTKLAELAPIENPPYNERLIRQAKIILDVYNVEINKWYQGERAISNADQKDEYFRAVVKAVKASESERIKVIAEAVTECDDFADYGVEQRIGEIKGIMAELEKLD